MASVLAMSTSAISDESEPVGLREAKRNDEKQRQRDGWRGLLFSIWYALSGVGHVIERLWEPFGFWR